MNEHILESLGSIIYAGNPERDAVHILSLIHI
jgi:hypothetical protein